MFSGPFLLSRAVHAAALPLFCTCTKINIFVFVV